MGNRMPDQHRFLLRSGHADERSREAVLSARVTLASMDAEREVMRAAEERASALAAGDADRLSALLHGDFRWTSHVGDTYDRSEYIRRNTEGDTVWRSQQLSRAEVAVVGDTAVLYADVTDVVLVEDDETETFRMPMTQVWVRLNGSWKCLAGHAGPRLA
jgi:ketosteroid isomerase-like protein